MILKTLLKISTLVATVVASSALASSAFAGQMNQDQNNFVNVGINGQYTIFSKAKLLDNLDVGGLDQSSKTKSMGYGATLGYEYALLPTFILGAELGYENLGKYKSTLTSNNEGFLTTINVEIKQHMFTALATFNYFITTNWNIIGKVGPAWVYRSHQ